MSEVMTGAEAPNNENQVVAIAPWKTDIYHAHWNSHESVFRRNNGDLHEFIKHAEWMPFVTEGEVQNVKELRDYGYYDKATKLLTELDYDGLLELLLSRKQGNGSGILTEEGIKQTAELVKERKARGGKFEFTDEERQIIVQWKRISRDTNSSIAELFGTTDQTVGKIIRAAKESES
ncbi:hypothetical protein [Algoriphagus aquimarinus]|uniref:hypothetical protein n=1 Tax=Algoriphagus aquimarinus TaxID=237018 RepID=UPI0030D6CE8D